MAKHGRNDPCPCGSGQKYKRCCLPKEEAAAAASRATHTAASTARGSPLMRMPDVPGDIADDLDAASNCVRPLIKAGKLDEAEKAAHDLLERFPQVHDGYDRLGMVYEARGDLKQAAAYYRKVIEFIRQHPDGYEPGFEDVFHRLVARLDPPAS
jgi:tetratricopeptide (TPR) repeat protein